MRTYIAHFKWNIPNFKVSEEVFKNWKIKNNGSLKIVPEVFGISNRNGTNMDLVYLRYDDITYIEVKED